MEDMLVLASFWSNLFYAARIVLTAVAFVAATAAIIYVGGPVLLAVGIGLVAGAATYAAISYFKPVEPPPPPPKPVITTDYRISIDFSPGVPHTIPYECIIHNSKIVTTTQGEKSDVQKFPPTTKTIRASDGKDFEVKFNNYLRDELKPLRDQPLTTLRSITIYEEPFPGETPLDMMYNACKDQFPDVELHTTQEEYHD